MVTTDDAPDPQLLAAKLRERRARLLETAARATVAERRVREAAADNLDVLALQAASRLLALIDEPLTGIERALARIDDATARLERAAER